MKKRLIILLIIFLIAGCNQAEETKNNDLANEGIHKPENIEQSNSEEQKKIMEKPKIIFSSAHSYRQGDGWLGESTEITGNSFKTAGESIFLELIFDTEIDYENSKDQIKLIGYDNLEIEKHYDKENALRIVARNIEHGKSYKLYVPRSIKDINENTLEKDIEIDIVLEEEPKAFYTFVGQEKTIDNLGEITDDKGNVHFSLPITCKTINIIIDFTKNVKTESVENSIRKSLGHDSDISFEWVNQQKLKLRLENLPANKEYLISMAEAIDKNNINIIGNLFFTVLEPSQLSSINLHTGDDKLLKEFIDMPYMIVPGENYEQYFIVDDAKKKYLLDIKQNTLLELPDFKYAFGYPEYEWYSSWLNSTTILALGIDTNTIYTHNLINNQLQKLFALPLELIKREVYDIKLSPDKKKIAITNSDTRSMDLYVFSLEGEMLYTGKEIAKTTTRNNGTNSMYLQWLNNNTIIFQDTRNVVKLDISTKNKEILIKDAIEPITCQNSNFVLVKKSGAYLYNMATNEGIKIGMDIHNFIFINQNELLYNADQDVVLLDILQNTKKVIGKGRIIGVSPERDKVYNLNNYSHVYGYYYLE